ncbi:MAG: hypothetical protein KAX49_12960 [Halanaerobiales bacterium]|nr:hypothetical protein [Halanaerobiales bacterium]
MDKKQKKILEDYGKKYGIKGSQAAKDFIKELAKDKKEQVMHSNYKNKMVKDEQKDTKVFLGVSVSSEVKNKLDKIKKDNGVPISVSVNKILTKHFGKECDNNNNKEE